MDLCFVFLVLKNIDTILILYKSHIVPLFYAQVLKTIDIYIDIYTTPDETSTVACLENCIEKINTFPNTVLKSELLYHDANTDNAEFETVAC